VDRTGTFSVVSVAANNEADCPMQISLRFLSEHSLLHR
jgi:hypothetical protein